MKIDFTPISQRYQRYYTYLGPIVSDPVTQGYFELAASFLLISFFIIFALTPTINTIVGLRKKIDDQHRVLGLMDKKISDLVAAQESYSQIESRIGLLLLALPEKPTPGVLVTDILRTGSDSGAVISGLQFQDVDLSGGKVKQDKEKDKDTGPFGVGFSLSALGSVDKVDQLIEMLENGLRYIRLSSLSETIGGDGNVTISAGGVGYYYRNE